MGFQQIGRVERPSAEEFQRDFIDPNLPVIITGAFDKEATKAIYNPHAIKAAFGEIVVSVRGSDNEFDVFFGKVPNQTMSLGAYIDRICLPEATDEPRPYFGNVSLTRTKMPGFAEKLKNPFTFPSYFKQQDGGETRIWFGGSGQKSVVHNDNYHNLNAQVFGRKEFVLLSPEQYRLLYTFPLSQSCWISPVDPQEPDLEKFPLFSQAEGYAGVLEEGEMLFIPIFWWHQAKALSVCINVNTWVYTGTVEYWEQDSRAGGA